MRNSTGICPCGCVFQYKATGRPRVYCDACRLARKRASGQAFMTSPAGKASHRKFQASERSKTYHREYQASAKERAKQRERASTTAHGITRAQRDALWLAQGSRCPCGCSTPEWRCYVDHDHACCPGKGRRSCGRCVRGLLCNSANLRDVLAGQPAVNWEILLPAEESSR